MKPSSLIRKIKTNFTIQSEIANEQNFDKLKYKVAVVTLQELIIIKN